MLTPLLSVTCPPRLRIPLARYLAGEISGEIVLMHFALQLGATGVLTKTVENLATAAPGQPELAELVRLAAANADHLAQVTALGTHGLAAIPTAPDDPIVAIRAQFDKAVMLAPEASVALYSLGSAEILDRATCEIVSRLADWGVLHSDSKVLDIGCGIGRIERALAPLVGAITAIDLSPGMIGEARRRCRHFPNVIFEQCAGRDLAGFAVGSFDLVLGIDSFPYLFAADPAISARHVRDAAQLLRPGGALAILNFSYRGDADADCREIDRLAGINGFTVQRAGTRDFSLWDGLTFLLTLPPGRRG